MSKTIRLILILTVCVFTSSAVKVWFDDRARKQEKTARDDAIYLAVYEINRSTPKMIDDFTRLDSATYTPGRITTFYTLPSSKKSDIDAKILVSEGRAGAAAQLCSDSAARKLLQSGVTYGYFYRDSSGSRIAEFAVYATDCH